MDRTIASDDALAKMLVAELGRRQVAGNAGIALVGQWDTAYSRRLAKLVEGAWYHAQRSSAPSRQTDPDRRALGTHGSFVQLHARAWTARSPAPSPGTRERGCQVHRAPSGEDQIDYLRRMRDALLAEDARRRQGCGWDDRVSQHCGIRAIGVLGNDYFDKLLVLQALKPVFPNAVFFTTDLYADMLHPQDNAFTRNLIVASGFGLTLAQDWQREVPPLRDSYQTALLLTVRLAVQEALGIERRIQTPPPPRLFEIGRTQAVELVTSPERDAEGQFRRQGLPPMEGPPPGAGTEAEHFLPQQAGDPRVQAVALPFALVLALGLGLAALGLQRGRAAVRRWWEGLRGDWLNSAIAAFSLARHPAAARPPHPGPAPGRRALHADRGGERLAQRDPAPGGRPHRRRPLHPRAPTPARGARGYHPRLPRAGRRAAAPGGEDARTGRWSALAPPCWTRGRRTHPGGGAVGPLRRRCGPRQTLRRVWPEILGFLLLAFSLMLMLGFPNRPTRSDLAWGLDSAIILLVLVPFLALLFFMVDATRQTLALARDLEGPVSWPAQTLRSLGLEAWIAERAGQPGGGRHRLAGCPAHRRCHPPGGQPGVVPGGGPDPHRPGPPPPVRRLVPAAGPDPGDGAGHRLRGGLCLDPAPGRRGGARSGGAGPQVSDLAGPGRPEARECLEALRTMLAEVLATRDGAFRPFSQQPVVQALLTLVSSVSGLALLEYSSMANLDLGALACSPARGPTPGRKSLRNPLRARNASSMPPALPWPVARRPARPAAAAPGNGQSGPPPG